MKDIKFCFKLLSYNKKAKTNLYILPIVFLLLGFIFTYISYSIRNDADDNIMYTFLGHLYILLSAVIIENNFTVIDQACIFRSSPIRYEVMLRLRLKFGTFFSIIAVLIMLANCTITTLVYPEKKDLVWVSCLYVCLLILIVASFSNAFKGRFSICFIIVFIISAVSVIVYMKYNEVILTVGKLPTAVIALFCLLIVLLQYLIKMLFYKMLYNTEWTDYYKKQVFDK